MRARAGLLFCGLFILAYASGYCSVSAPIKLDVTNGVQFVTEGTSGNHVSYGGTNCAWNATTRAAGHVIRVTIEYYLGSNNDRLMFYDGVSTAAPLLGIAQFYDSGLDLYSTGKSMFFRLSLDNFPKFGYYNVTVYSVPAPAYWPALSTLNYTATPDVYQPSMLKPAYAGDNGATAGYLQNYTTRWLIPFQAAGDKSIVLKFNVGQYSLVPGDLVKIYSGASESAPLLTTIGYAANQQNVASTSNPTLVVFSSLATPKIGYSGLHFHVTGYNNVPHCSGRVVYNATSRGDNGAIQEPLIGNIANADSGLFYAPGLACEWLLVGLPNMVMVLQFNQILLNSPFAVLSYYDGASRNSPIIATSKSFNYDYYASSTNIVLVTFDSDPYYPASNGASFTWRQFDAPVLCPSTPVTYQYGSGSFGLSYPTVRNRPYPANQNCTYIFRRVDTDTLFLKIQEMSLNPGDSMTIYTINAADQATVFLKYSGPGPYNATVWNFPDVAVMVVFIAGPIQGTGYGAWVDFAFFNYAPQCNGIQQLQNLPNSKALLSLNPYYQFYHGPIFCAWNFSTNDGKPAVFNVHQWSVRPGDTLTVYDGTSTKAPLLGNLTYLDPMRAQIQDNYFEATGTSIYAIYQGAVSGNSTYWGIDTDLYSCDNPTPYDSCNGALNIGLNVADGQQHYTGGDSPLRNRDCLWNFTALEYASTQVGFYFLLSDNYALTDIPNMQVAVYDGPSFNSPLIFFWNTTYQSPILYPGQRFVASTSRNMLVHWTTGATLGYSIDFKVNALQQSDFSSYIYSTGLCSLGPTMLNETISDHDDTRRQIMPTAGFALAPVSNMRCQWLIDKGPNTEGVWEIGHALQTYNPGKPLYKGEWDFKAYDGIDRNAPLLVSTLEPSFKFASGRYIFVEFNTSSAPQQPGNNLVMEYRLRDPTSTPYVPCSGAVTRYLAHSSCVGSTFYWDNLVIAPEDRVCTWHLTTVPGAVFIINCIYMALTTDTVTVYDGDDTSAPVLHNFTGTSVNVDPYFMKSTGTSVFVVYDTHGPVPGSYGFQITMEPTFPPNKCSGRDSLTVPWSHNNFVNWIGTSRTIKRPDPYPDYSHREYAFAFPDTAGKTCIFDIPIPYGAYLDYRVDIALPDGYLAVYNNGLEMGNYTGTFANDNPDQGPTQLSGNLTIVVVIGANAGPSPFFQVGLRVAFPSNGLFNPRLLAADDVFCQSFKKLDVYADADLDEVRNCTIIGNNIQFHTAARYSLPKLRAAYGCFTGDTWIQPVTGLPAQGNFSFPQLRAIDTFDLRSLALGQVSFPSLTYAFDFSFAFVISGNISLPALRDVANLKLCGGNDVRVIDLSGLIYILGPIGLSLLEISQNPQLENILLPRLRRASYMHFCVNLKLKSWDAPMLSDIDYMIVQYSLQTTFSLPSMTVASSHRGNVAIQSMSNLAVVDLSNVPGMDYLEIGSNQQLTTVLLPQLAYVYDLLCVLYVRVPTFQIPILAYVNSLQIGTSGIEQLVMPSLVFLNNMQVQATLLTEINLPALQTITGQTALLTNTNLARLNLCNMTVAGGVTVSACPLLSCAETVTLFSNAGAPNTSIQVASMDCNPNLYGTFGCQLNVHHTVDTAGCGYSVSCIQAQVMRCYQDKGSQVVIPAGTYTGCATPINTLGKIITIRGSGRGVTVIDCLGAGRAFAVNTTETLGTQIQDVTIVNTASPSAGGAILISNGAAATFFNVAFTMSTSGAQGGAVAVTMGGGVAVIGCLFQQNSASCGGALAVMGGFVTIVNTTFYQNAASEMGGGLLLSGCTQTPVITGSNFSTNGAPQGAGVFSDGALLGNGISFSSNVASQFGGGLAAVPVMAGAWTNLTSCSFSENTALTGGGVYGFSASFTLTSSTWYANAALGEDDGGGGLHALCAPNYRILKRVVGPCPFSVILSDTTWTQNTALGSGGGVEIESMSLIAKGSTFDSNQAQSGAAIAVSASVLRATGLTVTANKATTNGGGVYCEPLTGSCNVASSTFSTNTAVVGGAIYLCVTACPNVTDATHPVATGVLPDLTTGNTFANNVASQYGATFSTDPYQIAWAVAPLLEIVSGQPLASQGYVSVSLQDGYGQVASSQAGTTSVSLSIFAATGQYALTGPATVYAFNGEARFVDTSVVAASLDALSGNSSVVVTATLSASAKVSARVEILPCAEGQGRSAGATNEAVVCDYCHAGEAGSYATNYTCVQCPVGYSSAAGAASCDQCLAGFYAPTLGSTACLQCPNGLGSDAGSGACLEATCTATRCRTCANVATCQVCQPAFTNEVGGCNTCSELAQPQYGYPDCREKRKDDITAAVVIVILLCLLVIPTTVWAIKRPVLIHHEVAYTGNKDAPFVSLKVVWPMSRPRLIVGVNGASEPLTLGFASAGETDASSAQAPTRVEGGTHSWDLTPEEIAMLNAQQAKLVISCASKPDSFVVPLKFRVRPTFSNALVFFGLILEFFQLSAINFTPYMPFSSSDNVIKHLVDFNLVFPTTDIWSYLYWIAFAGAVVYLLLMTLIMTGADVKIFTALPRLKRVESVMFTLVLPLLGRTLYLTILNLLMSAFACTRPVTGNPDVYYLSAQLSIQCWTGNHWVYVITAFVVLALYFPIAVHSLPLWQIVDGDLDIRFYGTFLLVTSQVKFLLSAFGTLFNAVAVLHVVVVGLGTGFLLVIALSRKTSVVTWMRPVVLALYGGVFWTVIASAVALADQGNIVSSILLYIGWLVILIVLTVWLVVYARSLRQGRTDMSAAVRSNLSVRGSRRTTMITKGVELSSMSEPTQANPVFNSTKSV